MKNLIVITLLLSCFPVIAQRSCNMELNLINGYSNKPLEMFEVTIIGEEGAVIYSGITNDEGLLFVKKIKSQKLFIICKDEKGYFFEKSIAYIPEINKDNQLKLYLYPTPKYESLMYQIEDSIYGAVVKSSNFDKVNNRSIENLIIDSLSSEACFPGGGSEMQLFIGRNVMYPQESIEMNEQGKIYLEFVVEKNGFLSHVKILNGGASLNLNNEAKRLVRSMPNWVSGKNKNSEKVRTLCKLPINFSLN